jgi:carbonic anhydrase
MVGARARLVATTLGVMALAAIIVSRQSEGDWRGSSDKVTLAQDPYAEARGEMKARGPAINKLLEHSVELETRLANQEKAERQMADAVQAAQRKVDALKAKDAKLHMVIGWPQRGGAMPTTYPAFGGVPSQEDGAVEADGDLYAYDSSKPDAVLVVDGTTGVTSGSWWDNPMDWFKAGSASKSREVPMIRAPWDAQASYAQASWPPTATPSAAMPAEVERVKKLLDIQKTEEDLQKQKADVMDQIYADAQNGKLSNEAPVDAKVFAAGFIQGAVEASKKSVEQQGKFAKQLEQQKALVKELEDVVHQLEEDQKPKTAAAVAPATPAKPPAKHWTYSGEEGPEHWAELDPAYKTCSAGKEQSPIDFQFLDLKKSQLPQIGWHFDDKHVGVSASTGNTGESEEAGKEFYNGHTFEVEDLPGAPTIVIDGITYSLVQFHTHTPSEHTVAGRQYDMEMHFVHKAVVDGATKLAVVGIFYEKGDTSPSFIKALMREALPKATGTPSGLVPKLDFHSIAQEVLVGNMPSTGEFVPNSKNYFTYPGSLTTPPCSEGVKWTVLKNPLSIEAEDLAALVKLEGKNARPVQPLYSRIVQTVG